jgi:putative SOS response-associated peptidase YedK
MLERTNNRIVPIHHSQPIILGNADENGWIAVNLQNAKRNLYGSQATS